MRYIYNVGLVDPLHFGGNKMKIRGKITIVFVILVLSAAPAFSQMQIEKLQSTMDEFTDNLAKSLPFNSSMGLNWADAYIGKFPHFGIGFSFGLTTMDLGSFGKLLDIFAPALPGWLTGFGGFPIPGYAVEGRLGGFVLPFDIGFKFGLMPIEAKQFNKFDYFLIGGDVRYAIIEQNVILPTISVGVGFSYLSGALGMTAGADRKFSYTAGGTTVSATMKAPEITVDWSTASLDFKAQISKTFVFITPYLGVGANTGWQKAGFDVTMKTVGSDEFEKLKQIFDGIGINLSETGFSSKRELGNSWNARIFGGLTFTAAIARIELTAFYNFIDKYGATIGARIQL